MVETAGIIGKGIQIRGNLSGGDDLIIEGRVEGTISLQKHLTIEETGIVVADIESENLTIHGQVSGNVAASEKVHVSSVATVVGDIRAPRVVIEDGARFKGNVEMEVDIPKDI